MARSVGSVSVDVVPDAGGFREKLNSKLKGLRVNVGLEADVAKFREKIERATRVKALTVNVDADTKAARAQIDALQRNRSVTVDVDADTAVAEAKLDAVARGRKVDLDVDVDAAAATTQLAALGGAAGSSAFGMRKIIIAAAALTPALVPVTAAVGGLVAALSAPLAAAGGGLTVWGLLTGVAIKQANTNLKELEKAKEALGSAKKGTEEYRDALVALRGAQKQVTPIQQKFQGALQGVSDAVVNLGQKAGRSLLGPVIQGLNIAAAAISKSRPLIVAVGGAISDLLGHLGKAVRGPAFKQFIGWFAKAAPDAIKAFGRIMANIAVGVGGLVKAFAPLGRDLMKGLIGLTDRFADFGKTADSNKGVKGFIAYVREVGPKVVSFFGNMIGALVTIGKTLAPLGELMLAAFDGLFQLIKKASPELLAGIAAGIGAIMLAVGAGNPIIALVGIATGLAMLYKKSETFRKVVDKIWAGIKAGAVAVWKWINGTFLPWWQGKMWPAIKNAARVVWKWLSGTLWPGIKQVFGWIAKRATWLWKNAIQPAFKAIWKFISTQLMPIVRRLWHKVIKPAFKGIGVVIRDAWNGIIKPTLKALWWFIRKVLVPVIRWLWRNVVKPVFKFIGKAIAFAWKHVIKPTLNSLIDFISKVVFPVIRWLYKKVVKPTFKSIGGVISFAWHKVIKPAFGFLKDGFKAVGGVFKRIGRVISGVWAGIKSGMVSSINWIIDRINDLIGGINSVSGALSDALPKVDIPQIGTLSHVGGDDDDDGGGSGSKPRRGDVSDSWDRRRGDVPKVSDSWRRHKEFATGGYVTGPTYAMVGEGREAEAILPRSVLASLMRAAGAAGASVAGRGGRDGMVQPKGGKLRAINPFGDGKKMLRAYKSRVKPTLEGFVKGTKRANKASVSMERVVGKSSKRIGVDWKRLRKGDLARLNKAWQSSFSKEMPKRLRGFDTSTGKTVGRTGKRLGNFVKGPVSRLEKSWRQTMGTDLPKAANTMDSRVRATTQRTSKGLRNFGSVVRTDVPKAFRSGVDASAKQWDRVRKATGKPVKFVVSTVLNKGLIAAFNKIAKFVDTDPIKKLSLPKGFSSGGYTGDGGKYEPKGLVHGGEFVINKASTQKIERTNPGFLEHLNKTGFPGHAKGGLVNPDKRVYIDGEPIAAIAAAQLGLARQKLGRGMHLMQGGWQPATGYSGTSHQYPGVADTSPGSFRDQYWLRRVGFAAWARNIPGAHSAGDGAHVHSVSMLSPGTKASPQIAAYKAGGDGLGGSDYGDRPSWLPNLNKLLARFGPIGSLGGLGGAPALPKWAQAIVDKPKKWARGLLDGGNRLKGFGFGRQSQGLLNMLVDPAAAWAVSQLQKAAGTNGAGSFGSSVKGIWKSLMSTGYFSKQQAAGVMGNMKYESGFDPHITNGIGATGLVQWYPGSKLFAYLGDKVNNVANQVDTIVKQLRGVGPYPESAAGSALKATRTPERAALVFEQMFERHGGTDVRRQQAARAIFEQFGSGKFDRGGMAYGAGFLRKWTPQPERVLAPRQTAAFEQMVASNFQPNGNGGGVMTVHVSSGELDITENGKAMIRGQARAVIGEQVSHARTTGRQWR